MYQPVRSRGREHGFLRPQSVKHNDRTFLSEFLSREWGFLTCLVISLLPVLLICIFATPAFYAIDDVVQAMYPEGGIMGSLRISCLTRLLQSACHSDYWGRFSPIYRFLRFVSYFS